MRISDWSSDVCSSDLAVRVQRAEQGQVVRRPVAVQVERVGRLDQVEDQRQVGVVEVRTRDRQAVEIGRASCRERVWSVRVDLGGSRIIYKQKRSSEDITVRSTK